MTDGPWDLAQQEHGFLIQGAGNDQWNWPTAYVHDDWAAGMLGCGPSTWGVDARYCTEPGMVWSGACYQPSGH